MVGVDWAIAHSWGILELNIARVRPAAYSTPHARLRRTAVAVRVRTASLGYGRHAVAVFTNCSRGVYELQPLCIG